MYDEETVHGLQALANAQHQVFRNLPLDEQKESIIAMGMQHMVQNLWLQSDMNFREANEKAARAIEKAVATEPFRVKVTRKDVFPDK